MILILPSRERQISYRCTPYLLSSFIKLTPYIVYVNFQDHASRGIYNVIPRYTGLFRNRNPNRRSQNQNPSHPNHHYHPSASRHRHPNANHRQNQ